MIFNTTEGWQSLKDLQADPRVGARRSKIPYFTTASASVEAAQGDRRPRDAVT